MITTEQEEDLTTRDIRLVNQVLQGDKGSFEQLVFLYKDRLLTAMTRIIGCPDVAEDIVQDAFLKAFASLNQFKQQSRFYTWLFQIALNSRKRYVQHASRTLQLNPETCDCIDQKGQASDRPSAKLEQFETVDRVRSAISRLEEIHRQVLVLREFDNYDYEKIASILNLKTGTVRSRLSRARANLRVELQNDTIAT